jgi:hypothetical protein
MTTVELLVQELSEVQDLLIALPDDAFSEREELIRRRDELRARADAHAAGADHERPTEDLLAELVSLRMHRATAKGDDRLRIEGRIDRLEGILDTRGIAPV